MLKVYYPQPPFSSERKPDRTAWEVLQSGLQKDIEIITGLDLPQPADYHILISGRPSAEQIEASPNLHTLLIPWAGLPDVTADLMGQHPHIAIHNLHHNAVTTAETALTLMMAAAKYLLPIERTFRSLDWRPRYAPNPAVTLHGKTALILGYGSIGQHVGRVCAALGMHILATRRDPSQPTDAPGEVHPPDALHSLLPRANVLIITLPLTDETRALIGERELNLLPQNAVLVNIGRGAVVDQHALYQALKSGRLHSAGLDVWYSYPPDEDARAYHPPADVPFHELDNVVMSPHRGGGSAEIEILRMEHIVRFLNLAVEGKPLPNRVSLEKGY
jgi:phosphoglycerate dehydrogenase-like enzyme